MSKAKFHFHVIAFGILILFLVLISTIIKINLFSFRKNKSFIEKKEIIPIVKKPFDIFKTHPFFFAINNYYLDFSELQNQLTWKLDENLEGGLNFELIIYVNKENGKGTLPRLTTFSLFQKNGYKEEILFQKDISEFQFKEHKKYFYFKKKVKIFNKFKEGSLLCFKFNFLPEYENKQILYGITIPQIENSNLINGLSEKNPNLLILSIDTLRSDFMGVYKALSGESFEFSFSPNLDYFAQSAVLFKNAYTPLSATWPALASLFTSKYPFEHGIMYNREQLSSYFDTIATHMLNLGYSSLSLHGNAFGLMIPGIEEKYEFFNDDVELIKAAIRFLERDSHLPFFHWYHFVGVHAPYTPPKWVMPIIARGKQYRQYKLSSIMKGEAQVTPEDLEYIRMLYAGELYNLDMELKKIFDFLKINNLWDNSLIIVTSDHGEDLYQHHNHFYHYPSLYNTSLKIPLMIKFPFQRKQIVIKEPVSLLDLFPTIAKYFSNDKLKHYRDSDFSGLSLLPLLKGNKKGFKKRNIFAGVEEYKILSLLHKDLKVVFNPKKLIPLNLVSMPYPYEEIELYNLEKDSLEEKNIYPNNVSLARELIKQIEAFRKEHMDKKKIQPAYFIKTSKDISETILERLRTLGYIK